MARCSQARCCSARASCRQCKTFRAEDWRDAAGEGALCSIWCGVGVGNATIPVIRKNLRFLIVTTLSGWNKALALVLPARHNVMFAETSHWRAPTETDLGVLYLMKKRYAEADGCLQCARAMAAKLQDSALLAKIDAALAAFNPRTRSPLPSCVTVSARSCAPSSRKHTRTPIGPSPPPRIAAADKDSEGSTPGFRALARPLARKPADSPSVFRITSMAVAHIQPTARARLSDRQ
jgi:hypothetical protein